MENETSKPDELRLLTKHIVGSSGRLIVEHDFFSKTFIAMIEGHTSVIGEGLTVEEAIQNLELDLKLSQGH